ncbi:MAG: hypothetical protein IJH50_09490 [Kiritimatiellae bacterium]|nr:hypothetical protein [Kiritimatiellia bacterium]
MRAASAFPFLLCMFSLSAFGLEGGVLFRADFDHFMTTATDRNGAVEACDGITKDLQLRMHPGMDDKGNSLTLGTEEWVSWPLKGHVRPNRGTVSFWVKPCNYTIGDAKFFQPYLVMKGKGFSFYIYKYYVWGNRICAFYTPDLSQKRQRYYVCGEANWREDEWHRIDFAWDPNGCGLYIDGKEPNPVPDYPPVIEMDSPLPFPKSFEDGVITIDNPNDWPYLDKSRTTAFDDIEIRDYRMSEEEIFAACAKKRPDLVKGYSVSSSKRDPVKLGYECDPGTKTLAVRLDFAAVKLPMTNDYPVRLVLADKENGSVVESADVVFHESDSKVGFAFGDSVKEGHDYELASEIKGTGYRSTALFRVPDMEFLKQRIGLDHSVPSPWTPLEQDVGDPLVFRILDRTYEFHDGVMPTRVVSRGKELIVQPPHLELNGEKVVWKNTRVGEQHPDWVRILAEATVGGFKLRARGRFWFDGFVEYGFDMEGDPKRDTVVRSMKLKYSTPSEQAKFLFLPMPKSWKDGRYDCRLGFDFDNYSLVWTVGTEVGLAWYRENDANWVENGTADNVHLVRGEKETSVEIDIIAKETALPAGRTARYLMGFEATPPKRADTQHRSMIHGEGNRVYDWTWSGWRVSSGRDAEDGMLYWTTLVPAHPESFGKFLERLKRQGRVDAPYSMPMHICPLGREWDYFYPTWARHPAARWDFTEPTVGVKTRVMQCCGNTGAADWQLANIQKLFEAYPLLRGIYFDCYNVEFCDNERHGHGGTDAFGKHYVNSLALSHRSFTIRLVKLCRQYGKWFFVHAHSKYFPFVHLLSDGVSPGEEQAYPYIANPRYHYQEGISEEEYQYNYNCNIHGCGVYAGPQNVRARTLARETVYKDFDAYLGRNAILGAVPMSALVYDFQCLGLFHEFSAPWDELQARLKPLKMGAAEFHPYWIDPHAEAAKGIRTALYTWKDGEGPYPFLLVAANFSREPLATALRLDWAKAGAAPSRMKDLMTDKAYSPDELSAFALPSHEFMLMVPVK